MKATSSKANRIQNAIDGSEDDKLTRLSKTLNWLEEKYARMGDVDNRKKIERFSYPSKHGSFDKIFKAMAIVDKDFSSNELSNSIVKSDDIKVILFSIDDLMIAYETNRTNMIKSVQQC